MKVQFAIIAIFAYVCVYVSWYINPYKCTQTSKSMRSKIACFGKYNV